MYYSIKNNKISNILEKKVLKFLIIRNGLIGDLVFITPVIKRLIEKFPQSKIDLAMGNKTKELFINHIGINNFFFIPKEFNIYKHIKFFRSLRKQKYDIVLVHEVNTHYTLMSKFIKPKINIGFENSLSWLYNISVKRSGHAVEAEQKLIDTFIPKNKKTQTILYTSNKDLEKAFNLLFKEKISYKDDYICIQVACSEKNSVRQISNIKLSKLADLLIEKLKIKIIFTGVKEDYNEIKKVQDLMIKKSINLSGKTKLNLLIPILKKAIMVIGPDTGTLHIANAVGTPVLMYMGYADPKDTGPYDLSNISKYITSNRACIPCKHTDPKPFLWETCKLIRPTKCMNDITVEKLLEESINIIKKVKIELLII